MLDLAPLLRSAGFSGDGVDLATTSTQAILTGTTLDALATDRQSLESAVDDYAALQQEQFGPTAQRHVAALWLLQDVAWIHSVLAVGLIPMHGISVRASAGSLAMDLPRDMFFGVRLAEEGTVIDVATSAAERAELLRHGRAHLAELLSPLREPLHPHQRAGARAFWACVTDMATGAICTGSTHRPDALAQTLATFDDGTGPLLSGERLVPSPAGPIRRRHGCCLLYTIEGMSLCFSCPRIPIVGI